MGTWWRTLHLAAAAFWLGGLLTLTLAVVTGLRTLPRDQFRTFVTAAGRAFLAASVVAWAALAASGLALTLEHSPLASLPGSVWGRTLLLKSGLAVAVVLLAAGHVVLGRSSDRRALMASRGLAGLVFLGTLGVFFLAARLASM